MRTERIGGAGEVFRIFLRLGCTAFGGPAVHVAMMEEELVRRRGWISSERFLDLVAATNLVPGPNSTELALHLGRERAGWPGFFAAGAAFISPAMALAALAAALYRKFGSRPDATALLAGLEAAVVAVVAHALFRLAPKAVRGPWLAAIGAGALVASAAGGHELLVLAAAGLLGAAPTIAKSVRGGARSWFVALPVSSLLTPAGALGTAAAAGLAPSAGGLFLLFLKIGSVLYGSGYVLYAFLRADFVERLGWLDERQLLDAVAIGQLTPGPVFTTATFVGQFLAGPAGALLATLGIFLPAFVFVALSGPFVERLRRSAVARDVLAAVAVASLALMATTLVALARVALAGVAPALFAVAAFAALLSGLRSPWVLLAGAVFGAVFGAASGGP